MTLSQQCSVFLIFDVIISSKNVIKDTLKREQRQNKFIQRVVFLSARVKGRLLKTVRLQKNQESYAPSSILQRLMQHLFRRTCFKIPFLNPTEIKTSTKGISSSKRESDIFRQFVSNFQGFYFWNFRIFLELFWNFLELFGSFGRFSLEFFWNSFGILREFCENSFGILREFFGNSAGILWEFCGNSAGILWEFFGAKFLTFLDSGGIWQDLFSLYSDFQNQLMIWVFWGNSLQIFL